MSKFAWVTLTTNDTYSLGALVLAHSLRKAKTQHQLAVLVTTGVSESMRNKLKDVYNVVQEVNIMDSQDAANLALLARPELGITFTKLHCWRLVQFEKCVFLDSDTLVLQNCDELFEREEFSAAPDVSWPDCFNSGVFVYKPSQETFDKIVDFGLKNGSFDGGDQGLLNQYFADWATCDTTKRLPFLYNVAAYASYCYLPAFKQFRDKIKILHFAGKMKPWLIHYNSQSQTPSVPSDYAHASDLIQYWWNIFFDHVHQILNDNMRYSLPITMAFQLQQQQQQQQHQQHYKQTQIYQEQQQQHQQQQHATNMHYNIQYENYPSQYEYINSKIEFHDPWEDYYRKQVADADAEVQENQINCTTSSDSDSEANHKFEFEKDTDKEEEEEEVVVEQQSDISYGQNSHTDVVHEESDYLLDFEERQKTEAKELNGLYDIFTTTNSDDTINNNNNNNIELTEIRIVKDTADECQVQYNCNGMSQMDFVARSRSSSIESNCHQAEVNNNYDGCGDNRAREEVETNAEEAGLAGALSQLRLGEPRSPEQDAYEHLMRRQCWESGHVDYSGRDSFDNIWKKITETLETKPDNNDKTGSS